jgi:hypothetical protein
MVSYINANDKIILQIALVKFRISYQSDYRLIEGGIELKIETELTK